MSAHPMFDDGTPVEIDFAYLHGTPRQHGDITTMLTWNWAEETLPPVLLLAPTYGNLRTEGPPSVVVIAQGDAWKWSRSHNDDREMVGVATADPIGSDAWQNLMAGAYAAALNFSPHDPGTRRRIRGIVEDQLGDLVFVPPAPRRRGRAHADFTVSELGSGRVVDEIKVEDR